MKWPLLRAKAATRSMDTRLTPTAEIGQTRPRHHACDTRAEAKARLGLRVVVHLPFANTGTVGRPCEVTRVRLVPMHRGR